MYEFVKEDEMVRACSTHHSNVKESDSSENDNEPSNSINSGEFLDSLMKRTLFHEVRLKFQMTHFELRLFKKKKGDLPRVSLN